MSHRAIFFSEKKCYFSQKKLLFLEFTTLGLEWDIVDYSIYGDGFSIQVRVEVLLV